MIEIYFLPYGMPRDNNGRVVEAINFRHSDPTEYLGIAQQLFAQMMGWA